MLKFKILILLSINCIYVYCCQRDNDCGTSFYKCSFNNFQISQGIGYDNVEKKVVVFGKFDGYIQPSIISIYDNGTLKEDYQVLSDSYTVYQHITGLKYYNQKSKISYLSYDLHRGPGVGYFNPNNNTQRIIYSGPYPAYVFQDDINSSYIISTPVGSYKQSIYDTLQTKTQQLDFRSYWFTKENNSIFYFMLGNENEVRRFDDSCTRNCQSDLLFNLTFTPSVFEKSPTHFYFGNSTILYKFYLNGTVANTYSIPNLNSIVFNQEKNKLYLNTGSSIKVLVLLPNGSANIQTVYSKLPNVGICKSLDGFINGKCFSQQVDYSDLNNIKCVFKKPF